MAPGARPGTLEWHADQRPGEAVLLTPGSTLRRADWEAEAEALAQHLATERGVGPGDLLSAAGRVDPAWLTLAWAAAKLGAGLAGLPPGPVVALDGAIHVGPADHAAAADRPPSQGAPRRLSGTHPPPDSVTFSRLGRPVRRRFPPAGVPAIGATLADLVARLRAAPGTTLAAAGPVSDPLVGFLAGVVLVGGGRVLTAATAPALLSRAAGCDADLAALAPGELDGLAVLAPQEREALDLTSLAALVIGGAPFAADVAEDLFGDVLDVYATAETGTVAVRAPGYERHELLDGVQARTRAGQLEIRSPLAAAAGWIATGDRAALSADGMLRLGP